MEVGLIGFVQKVPPALPHEKKKSNQHADVSKGSSKSPQGFVGLKMEELIL